MDKRINWENLPCVLTVRDVRSILRLGQNATYELFHREDFPAIKVGRVFRVSKDALKKWLENAGK